MDQIEQNLSRIRNALRQHAAQASNGEPMPVVNEPQDTESGVFFVGSPDANGAIERHDLCAPSSIELDNADDVKELGGMGDDGEADVWSLIRHRLGLVR